MLFNEIRGAFFIIYIFFKTPSEIFLLKLPHQCCQWHSAVVVRPRSDVSTWLPYALILILMPEVALLLGAIAFVRNGEIN